MTNAGTTVEVRPVTTRRDVDAFVAVAARAQACNPRFVAPLEIELRQVLDTRRSPFRETHEIAAFVAWRGGQPVGRIAAIVDKAHLARHGDETGHFGLFEVVDDEAVVDALIDAAAAWLAGRRLRAMRGPYSISINHEVGLLVCGYDEPHVVRTNHAPAHYALHLERLGFRKAMDLHAEIGRVAEMDFPERMAALAGDTLAAEIEIRSLSLRTWSTGIREVLRLYNDAWADNWGAVPVGEDEAALIARLTLPVIKPSWIRIAYHRGVPVALVSQIPDVNEAMAPLRGRLAPFGWARLLWRVHCRRVQRTRLAIVGVARSWRGTPTGSLAIRLLLAQAVIDARRAGVVEMETSWILETNTAMIRLARSLPTRRSRTFRLYERGLDSLPAAP